MPTISQNAPRTDSPIIKVPSSRFPTHGENFADETSAQIGMTWLTGEVVHERISSLPKSVIKSHNIPMAAAVAPCTGEVGIDSTQVFGRVDDYSLRLSIRRDHQFTVHDEASKNVQLWCYRRSDNSNDDGGESDVWGSRAEYKHEASGIRIEIKPVGSRAYYLGVNCYLNFSVARIAQLLWQEQKIATKMTGKPLNVVYAPLATTSDITLKRIIQYVQQVTSDCGLNVDVRRMRLSRLDLFVDNWLRTEGSHLHAVLEQLDPFRLAPRRRTTQRFKENHNFYFSTKTRALLYYDKLLENPAYSDIIPAAWAARQADGWSLWRAETRLLNTLTIQRELTSAWDRWKTHSPLQQTPNGTEDIHSGPIATAGKSKLNLKNPLPAITVAWLIENQACLPFYYRTWMRDCVFQPQRLNSERALPKHLQPKGQGHGSSLENLECRIQKKAKKKRCSIPRQPLKQALRHVHHDPRPLAEVLKQARVWSSQEIFIEVDYLRLIWWQQTLADPQLSSAYRELFDAFVQPHHPPI